MLKSSVAYHECIMCFSTKLNSTEWKAQKTVPAPSLLYVFWDFHITSTTKKEPMKMKDEHLFAYMSLAAQSIFEKLHNHCYVYRKGRTCYC